MNQLLWNSPEGTPLCTLLLAHGAGAPMDSDFMELLAVLLAQAGIQVARFEFPYMHMRRSGGVKRPPDRQPLLLAHFAEQIAKVRKEKGAQPLFIGGKSMGGRMATLIAAEEAVSGVICFGYPFHPPGKLDKTRIAHLKDTCVPTLICQGERDTFGKRDEVESYPLSDSVKVSWLADGDHDLKPRKRSGLMQLQNVQEAVRQTLVFCRSMR